MFGFTGAARDQGQNGVAERRLVVVGFLAGAHRATARSRGSNAVSARRPAACAGGRVGQQVERRP